MAVFHTHTVHCRCGAALDVLLADSINIQRSPAMRERILREELHRARCASCGRVMTVEKPFFYTDLVRGCLFKVLARGERHTWKEASRHVEAADGFIAQGLPEQGRPTLRVVFGMDELREKLVAQDAGLDDRVVELVKVLLIADHPILLRRPRLRLVLREASATALEFSAAYEHDAKRFRASFPRDLAREIAAAPGALHAWTRRAHKEDLFKLPDHWVNLWRWSPQPSALSALRGYAEQLDLGATIDPRTKAFGRMLDGLPRGNHLPSWAKRDLQKLFGFARSRADGELQDRLFEIRFGVELEDDWATNNDETDIDTLWKLLRDLPDSNVEGNTKLNEILLDSGGGGGYEFASHDISIGSEELRDREGFEDVVRHEVGHAVHEKKKLDVDKWLSSRFGWRMFEASDAGIDAWVELMGGWGAVAGSERRQCRAALRSVLGDGSSWTPGPRPHLPSTHAWNAATFGPRLAYEKTGRDWFVNYATWHRAAGRAFFLNYWYATLVAVDVETLDLVARMPDAYASMSPLEFFAELYALYYDLDDPKRDAIPVDVVTWMKKHIGAAEVRTATSGARVS